MLRTTLFLLFLMILNCSCFAQNESLLITKNFKFQDGIYLTLQDLQKNQPNYNWNQVTANLASSDEGFIVQVETISIAEQALDLQQIWGICIKGMPYIRVPKGERTKAATVFAGLRVRGKICYFDYEEAVQEMREMKAYNPVTGRVFRTATLPVEKTVQRQQILHLETGEVVNFTKANFLNWIEDDRPLWNTVAELQPAEVREKLFKCLLIYVDRNPVYLK
jgi:hypothetical protein